MQERMAMYSMCKILSSFCVILNILSVGANNFTECRIVPLYDNTSDRFNEFLEYPSMKMIRIHTTFEPVTSGPLTGLAEEYIFRPLDYIFVKGSNVKDMLLLSETMRSLPSSALNYGVYDFEVTVTEHPQNCYYENNMNITHMQEQMRNLIWNQFGTVYLSVDETEFVCSQIVQNVDGFAEYPYTCCQRIQNGTVYCDLLQDDFWILTFKHVVSAISIVLILLSPYFVPKAWYREKYINAKYIVTVPEAVEIKMLKRMGARTSENINEIDTREILPTMSTFQKVISEMEENKPYTLSMKKLWIKIKAEKLLSADHVSINFFQEIFNSIFRCKIAKRKPFHNCCNANIFEPCAVCKFSWSKLVRRLMIILLYLFLTIPWILRVYVFYQYEETTEEEKESAAVMLNLQVPFPGSLVTYLTPIHGLFVFCYTCLFCCFLVLAFDPKFSESSRYLIRQCFRDVESMNRSLAVSLCVRIVLIPFQRFGIFALIVVWIYWLFALPLLIIIVVLYFIPIANIFIRLISSVLEPIVNFEDLYRYILNKYQILYSDFDINLKDLVKKDISRPQGPTSNVEKCIQVSTSLFFIMSILALLPLVLEFMVFTAQYLIYQFVGLILNWNNCYAYLVFALLIWGFAKSCFGSVKSKYQTFTAIILGQLNKRFENMIDKEPPRGKRNSKRETYLKDVMISNHENNAIRMKTIDKTKSTIKDATGNTADEIEAEGKQPLHKNNDGNQSTVTIVSDENTLTRTSQDDPIELKVKGKHLKWKLPNVIFFLRSWQDNPDKYVCKEFITACAKMPIPGCPGNPIKHVYIAVFHLMKLSLFMAFVIFTVGVFGEKYHLSGINQVILTATMAIIPFLIDKDLITIPPDIKLNTSDRIFNILFNELVNNFSSDWDVFDVDENYTLHPSEDEQDIQLVINTSSNKRNKQLDDGDSKTLSIPLTET